MIQETNPIIEDENKWMWLPKRHILHLISFYALVYLIMMFFSLPLFGEDPWFWPFLLLAPIIPLWQSNILANSANKRVFHIHSRGIYGVCMAFAVEIRRYILFKEFEFFHIVFIFFLLIVFSGVYSLPLYFTKRNFFTDKKKYFLQFFNYISPAPICFTLYFVITTAGWLNPHRGELLHWSDDMNMSFEDFKGHPNLFSEYAAAIRSDIDTEFDDNGQLKSLNAVCMLDQTWVNPWDKDESYFLLQHEVYHFNITEMVTRMARKAVYEAIQNEATKYEIEQLILDHRILLDETQDKYDFETDHSLIIDAQSRWQYVVDSTLSDLDAYWNSNMFKQNANNTNTKYYRSCTINEQLDVVGRNALLPNEELYAKHYKFSYNDNKELKKIAYYKNGKLTKDEFFGAAIVRVKTTKAGTSWSYYDKNNVKTLGENGYHKKEYDTSKKYETTLKYFDVEDNQIEHSNGYYTMKISLDTLQRMSDKYYLDKKENRIKNTKGFYHRKYYYKKNELFSYKDRNYGPNHKPINNADGEYENYYEYNEVGNITKAWSKNTKGKFVYTNGHAIIEYIYNELGVYVAAILMDENNNWAEDEKGIAKYDFLEDRFGNINRRTYYNSNKVLTNNENGIATSLNRYNKKGELLSVGNYDTGSLLIFDEDGYGKVAYKYDSLGRKKYIVNYNGYDNPFKSSAAGPIESLTYDSLDHVIRGDFLNVYYQPDTSLKGVSHYKRLADDNNNAIEIKYFDEKDSLVPVNLGVAIFRYKYDKNNNKIKTSYFTVNDQPAYSDQGASVNLYKYDKAGNMTERSYLDTNGVPIEYDDYAKLKYKYDDNGNMIECRYYNWNNQLMNSGLAILKQGYDATNNLLYQSEYTRYEEGIIKRNYKYDKLGNEIALWFTTTNNQPITKTDNIHRYKYQYKNKLYMGESYYGVNGRLIENESGIARVKIIRNEKGIATKRKTYGKNNQLKKDEATGYAMLKYLYDPYKRIIEENYYDNKQELIEFNDFYTTVKYNRDNSGNILKTHFYNTEGELVEDENGVALYVSTYNRNGVSNGTDEYDLSEALEYLMIEEEMSDEALNELLDLLEEEGEEI